MLIEAALFGKTPEQIMVDVDEDWKRLGHMQPGHLPAAWRDGHLVYSVSIPLAAGWWIDAHAQETLDTRTIAMGSQLSHLTGRHDVDRGIMFNHDCEIITRLAEWMRKEILDDGTKPLGVRFESRISNGNCWALWMRRSDAKLGGDPIEADEGAQIPSNDAIMRRVTEAFGIHSW